MKSFYVGYVKTKDEVAHMSHSQPLVYLLANTQLHPHKLSFRQNMLLSQNYYWSHGNLYKI